MCRYRQKIKAHARVSQSPPSHSTPSQSSLSQSSLSQSSPLRYNTRVEDEEEKCDIKEDVKNAIRVLRDHLMRENSIAMEFNIDDQTIIIAFKQQSIGKDMQ